MTIVISSPINFEPTADPRYMAATYDPVAEKIVLAYKASDLGDDGYVILGTVTNDNITFSSPVEFDTTGGLMLNPSIAYDSISGKVVVVTAYGKAFVGTIAGGTITFGSAVVFNSGAAGFCMPKVCVTSSGIVIVFLKESDSYKPYAIAGTVSGTSITFGSAVTLDTVAASSSYGIKIAYDSSTNKHLVVWSRSADPWYGMAVALSVSGTTITYGTATVVSSERSNSNTVYFDGSKFIAMYETINNHKAYAITISSLVLSVGITGNYGSTVSIYNPHPAYSSSDGCCYLLSTNYNTQKTELRIILSNSSIAYSDSINVDSPTNGTTANPEIIVTSAGNKVLFYSTLDTYLGYASIINPAPFWTNFRSQTELIV